MKFAIVLLAASIASAYPQGPFGGAPPYAGLNPFAVAYSPYLSAIYGSGAIPPAGAAPTSVAAPAPVAQPFAGFSVTSFFQSVVLQKEAERLLSQPNFPEDLATRVQNVLEGSELGFSNCSTAGATLPWMQIRCIKPTITKAKNDLKLIDDEWTQRQTAAAAQPQPKV